MSSIIVLLQINYPFIFIDKRKINIQFKRWKYWKWQPWEIWFFICFAKCWSRQHKTRAWSSQGRAAEIKWINWKLSLWSPRIRKVISARSSHCTRAVQNFKGTVGYGENSTRRIATTELSVERSMYFYIYLFLHIIFFFKMYILKSFHSYWIRK